jgi:hypothetical protein
MPIQNQPGCHLRSRPISRSQPLGTLTLRAHACFCLPPTQEITIHSTSMDLSLLSTHHKQREALS